MSEENKILARDSWEKTVNQRDLDAIEEIYAPDFVWHEPDQDIRGYEQARQFASTFFDAFPDINITIEGAIAERDQVATRYTIRGTHRERMRRNMSLAVAAVMAAMMIAPGVAGAQENASQFCK